MKIAALMLTSFILAISLPHMPESDGLFIITVATGMLIGFTIWMIRHTPTKPSKPVAWSVLGSNKKTSTPQGAIE